MTILFYARANLEKTFLCSLLLTVIVVDNVSYSSIFYDRTASNGGKNMNNTVNQRQPFQNGIYIYILKGNKVYIAPELKKESKK
jgi:hypothetical protein